MSVSGLAGSVQYPGTVSGQSSAVPLGLAAPSLLAGSVSGYVAGRAPLAAERSFRGAEAYSRSVRRYGGGYGDSYGYGRYGVASQTPYGTGAHRFGFEFTRAVKSSMIWGGLVSLGVNTYLVSSRQQSGGMAAANVAGDVMSSALCGTVAAAASTLTASVFGALLGTGWGLGLAGIVVGLTTYACADAWLRQTPLYRGVQQTMYDLFG